MYEVPLEAYTRNDVATLKLLWYRAALDTIDEYLLGEKGLQPAQPPNRNRPGWQKVVGKVGSKIGSKVPFTKVGAGIPTLVQKPAPTFAELKTALEDEIDRLKNLPELPESIVNGLEIEFEDALKEELGPRLALRVGTSGKTLPRYLAAALRAYFRQVTWAEIMEQLKNRYIQNLNGANQQLARPWAIIDRTLKAPPRRSGDPELQYRCVITPVNEAFDPTFARHGATGFASMAPRLTVSEDRVEQHRATNLWHSRFEALPGNQVLFECFRSGAVCYPFGDVAENVRKAAATNKARELLTAVLLRHLELMEDEAVERVLDGEPARIKLASVSLQTALDGIPGKVDKWAIKAMKDMIERQGIVEQFWALRGFDTKSAPVRLEIVWRGVKRKVSAFFEIATFNFGVNGAMNTPGTDAIEVQNDFNREAMAKLGPWYDEWLAARQERKQAIEDRLAGDLPQGERDELMAEHIEVDRRIRWATQLRAQLDEYIFSGSTVYDSPSRVTNLAHLMGCAVHFNCKSGKDRTSVLALESHFLAWQMHERDLVPPYQNKLAGDAKLMHRRLVFESGNLEIQRYNTGIPGYKIVPMGAMEMELAERLGKHLKIAQGLCRLAAVKPTYQGSKGAKNFEPLSRGQCLEIAERFVNPR